VPHAVPDQFFEHRSKSAAINEASSVDFGLGGLGKHRPGKTARTRSSLGENAHRIGQPRRGRSFDLRDGSDNPNLMLSVEGQRLGKQPG